MAGFSCGIGGMMVISQLRTIFGYKAASADASLFGQLEEFFANIYLISQWSTTLTALVVVIVVRFRLRPLSRINSPRL